MQAYATAEPSPLEPITRLGTVAPGTRGSASAKGALRMDTRVDPSALLASLVFEALDDHALAVLAQRLEPHIRRATTGGHIAYTVASLANDLGVSEKAIRCAITRKELAAVKRGSRWIISADAVQTWATASETRRRTSRTCLPMAPKAAGPSLRSVLCGEPRTGGAR